MKKLKGICLAIATIFVVLLVGCDLGLDKAQSIKFNNKISNATEYSFNIVYTDSSSEGPVYISCYQKKGDYAYRFSQDDFDNAVLSYRQIFSDNTFYEICEAQKDGFWCGTYKKTEKVSVDYDGNFVYKYTKKILTGSLTTLLQKGTTIEYNGQSCTEYNVNYDNDVYTFVFEDATDNLVKFVLTSGDNVKTLEYSNYKFEDINEECFKKPTVSVGLDGVQFYKEVTELPYEFSIS